MSALFEKSWGWSIYTSTTSEERNYLDEILKEEIPQLNTTRFYYGAKQGRTILPSTKPYTPLYPEDAMFTPNLFKGSKNATNDAKSLYKIKTLAIDVDFSKSTQFKGKKPLGVYEYMMELVNQKIPPPSYVEYGHNFRLIYILSEAIAVGTGSLKVPQAIEKRICDIINEEGDFHAEPQKLNSFLRYPGSINTKDGSAVHVRKESDERLTFQEIFEYLPDPPDWYEKWKSNKKTTISKKDKVLKLHNNYTLCKERLAWFEKLAKEGYDENRYNLCYLYAQHLAQIEEYDIEKVLTFNQLLHAPLPEKELRSKLNYVKKYKRFRYKDQTISELLGVEKMTSREKEKQAKILAGTTRKQIAEANYLKAKELRKEGHTRAAIAKEMGMSEETIKKYFRRMREEGE